MSFGKSTAVMPPYSEIYLSSRKTVRQITQEMQKYHPRAITHMCAQLSILLSSDKAMMPESQVKIAQGIMSPEARQRLKEYIEKAEKGATSKPSYWGFFHSVPLMMLLKINLESNTPGGAEINTEEARNDVAMWLFSLTDMWSTGVTISGLPKPRMKESLRIFNAKQWLIGTNTEPVLNTLARGMSLIKIVKRDTRINCADIFEKATGLTLEEYYSLLFMILSDWRIETTPKSLDEIAVRTPGKFFEETTVADDKVKRFISLLGFTVEEYPDLQAKYTQDAQLSEDIPTNFLCFMHKPLLYYEDKFLCVSPHFLAMKMTEGPYRIIEEELKANERNRQTFAQMWGDAFETYTHERLNKIFPGGKYHESPLTLEGVKTIDGIAEGPNAVFLLEYKFAHWKFVARLLPTKENTNDFLSKVVSYNPRFDKKLHKKEKKGKKKGLGQIKYYLEQIDDGKCKSPVDLTSNYIFPVLVLGEEYPPDPFNREHIEGYASSVGCYISSANAQPFIVLSSEEIELLESISEKHGAEMATKMLAVYSRSFTPSRIRNLGYLNRPTSFKNELINAGFAVENNSSLQEQLDELFEETKKYFKSTK